MIQRANLLVPSAPRPKFNPATSIFSGVTRAWLKMKTKTTCHLKIKTKTTCVTYVTRGSQNLVPFPGTKKCMPLPDLLPASNATRVSKQMMLSAHISLCSRMVNALKLWLKNHMFVTLVEPDTRQREAFNDTRLTNTSL